MKNYEIGFSMDVRYGNKRMKKAYAGHGIDIDWMKDTHPWTVTLKYKRRQMTFDFWTGKGIGEPTLGIVLDNIIRTTTSIDDVETFEEWCDLLGYSTDSRQAYEGYKQSVKLAFKFKKLVRDDYECIVKQYERWNG